MSTNTENKILATITVVVLILVIIQASYNITKINKLTNNEKIVSKTQLVQVSDNKISAKVGYADIGRAEICINIPPILTNDCNMTDAVLSNTLHYNCTFEAIDPNDDDVEFSAEWLTTPILFNITSYGEANFNPKKSSLIDINTFRIIMNDSSGCANSESYEEFNVIVLGENRPPYLMTNISDQNLIKNQYLRFYLNDYFSDPDEDELAYFSVLQEGNTVRIKIQGNMVEIKGQSCGISKAYFVATDPSGLTAQSNIVKYNITCSEDGEDNQGDDNQDNSGGGSSSDGNTRICTSDWVCSSWAPCLPQNLTYKRCLDYNGCEKDYEQYLYDNCTYEINTRCDERWDCNDWSTCENGIRTRMCMDLRSCGTNSSKPLESEECNQISACYNGIKDGDETGIDCGGLCGACRLTESPAQINKISPLTLITIGFTIGLTIIILFIFRDKIRLRYNKLFSKSKIKKRIYITDKQKDSLIQSINIIQARIDENKIDHAIDEMNVFIKEYFKQLLAIDIINKEELLAKIIKLNDKDLEKILIMFYAKITNIIHLRNTGINPSIAKIQSLTDEISNRVYMIAKFNDSDALNSIKDRVNTSQDITDTIYNKLSNVYIALKFEEITITKNIYKEILKDYDKLLEKEKAETYNDIIRAYESILYLEKQYSKK
ncbi:MAG: hypothetical protein ACP5N1_05210 [Candidatus Woesearchaeota archaeon]